MLGITIDGKHTWNDWGLRWVDYAIGYPPPKTYTVDVPGSDGELDLTESLSGRARYGMRAFTFIFESPDRDFFEYEKVKLQIADYLHGRKRKLTLDTDPNYYYFARLEIDFQKTGRYGSELTITGVADPYKYEQFGSGDEWLWDPFDFNVGDIRQANEILIDGTKTVVIPPTRIPVVPKFICSATMNVTFREHVVNLPEGEYESPYIEFDDNENILIFEGDGTVGILYRGGAL